MLIVLGLLLIAGVGAWQLEATLWTTHSNDVGRSLVHQFLKNKALTTPVTSSPAGGTTSGAASTASLSSCAGSSGGSDPVAGLLEIPKLGLVAPVEQGVGDTQLAVAVGHEPHSVWPGTDGTAVLEAHDVSYFTGLPNLVAGNVVRYVTPCTTYTFTVSAHTIVSQGSPVYNTLAPSLTLVTCWPTDALWFTPDRYLITATETGQSRTASSASYRTVAPPPTPPVPAPLASQGVTLTTYSLAMGTFTLSGTPDPAWAQTTEPLLDQGSGVEGFIAAVRALTENQLDWWSALAPGVTAPAPLVGAHNPGYLTPLDVTLTASGSSPISLTLSNTVTVTGGTAPGRYAETVTEAVHGSTLVVTGWSMQRD